jgi:signal transduction histidine kinase
MLVRPPGGELWKMALYLLLAGTTTLAVGSLAVRLVWSGSRQSIRATTLLGASAGTVVALLNVLIVAELMFISTEHDLQLLIALIVFGGLVSLCLTAWVAGTLSNRLASVASAIQALASGNYDSRVIAAGRDEIAQLGLDLNMLGERLKEAEAERRALDAERRELTAAISHDLRTPLSSMRAMVGHWTIRS